MKKLEEMKKLDEDMKKLEDNILLDEQLNQRLIVFLNTHKDNVVLKEYMEILEAMKSVEKEYDEAKKYLYDDMINADAKERITDSVSVKLTKPYMKKVFDLKQFLDDYKSTDELYLKYVSEKEVKGHINIKKLED